MAYTPFRSFGRITGSQPTLDPEEEQSLLRTVGRKTLGGVAALGNFLMLPGSMVRDVLAFENPLDQLLSPFSDENRTSGRDLLRKYGLVGKKDTKANWLGGFAADILTDPLTYLTFGASGGLTKAGQIAEKAGILGKVPEARALAGLAEVGKRQGRMGTTLGHLLDASDDVTRAAAETAAEKMGTTLAEHLDKPLGSMARTTIPFTNKPFGPGAFRFPGDEKLAKGLDIAGETISKTAPVRYATGLFSRAMQGATSVIGQKYAPGLKAAKDEAVQSARYEAEPAARAFTESKWFDKSSIAREPHIETMRQAKAPTEEIAKAINQTHNERSNQIFRYIEGIDQNWAGPQDLREPMQYMKTKWAEMGDEFRAAGGDLNNLNDEFMDYMTRLKKGFETPYRGTKGGGRKYSTQFGSQMARKEFLTQLPEGTAVIQEMSTDPNISGWVGRFSRDGKLDKDALEGLKAYVKDTYGNRIGELTADNELFTLTEASQMPRGALTDKKLTEITSWLAHLDPRHALLAEPIYETNPAKAFVRYMENSKKAASMATSFYSIFQRNVRAGMMAGGPDEKLTSLKDALRGIFVKDKAGSDITEVAKANMLRAMEEGTPEARQVLDEVRTAFGNSQLPPEQITDKILENVYVPKELADDAKTIYNGYRDPEALKPFLAGMDRALNWWRSVQTAMVPNMSFHTRNHVSGMMQSWFGHAWTGDIKPYQASAKILMGENPEWLKTLAPFKGMTAEQAATEARRLAWSYGLMGGDTHLIAEATGQAGQASLPGKLGRMFTPAPAGATLWDQINPLTIGTKQGVNAMDRWGRDIGTVTEGMNRLTPWLDLIKQGWSPAAAAERVKFLQIDYASKAALDPMMRRVFPFWSFQRGVLPTVVESLVNRPGGRMATTIKATSRAHAPSEITPDYVASTAAIPFPIGQKEGTQRYLTGFGMMYEDPLGFGIPIPGVGTGVRQALAEGVSRLNPMIKAPLEWASGQSFFQQTPMGGRPLEDMDPTMGRTVANISDMLTGEKTYRAQPLGGQATEFLLGNTIGRPLTSLRTLTDPRKGLIAKAANLGTGFRVADVSEASQDAVIQEQANAILKQMGAKSFAKMFIPDDVKAKMSPQQREMADQWMALQKILDLRAKARKEKRMKEQAAGKF